MNPVQNADHREQQLIGLHPERVAVTSQLVRQMTRTPQRVPN